MARKTFRVEFVVEVHCEEDMDMDRLRDLVQVYTDTDMKHVDEGPFTFGCVTEHTVTEV